MVKISYISYLLLIPFTHNVLHSIIKEIFLLNNNLKIIFMGIILGIMTVFFIGLYYFKGIEFFEEIHKTTNFKTYVLIWVAFTIYLNILLITNIFPAILYVIINLIIYQALTIKISQNGKRY